MSYSVNVVLPKSVDRLWPMLEIQIARYLKVRTGGYRLKDVKKELETGESVCYIIVNDSALCGVCVFHVEQRPVGKTLFISGLAGSHMHEWIGKGLEAIRSYANTNKIETIEAQVRPGLRKTLLEAGWRHAADIMVVEPWAEAAASHSESPRLKN